ncbi:DNA primase [Alteriqipengyuania lutimaris]|uniref:DNA primase n=1 Tax=Alteriqipengyuania lutimaris TaxID=1538146 RepID=A0A395LLV9_9SPHN|nr:DNA primase [Alteriqipengyuania lutimaris]MBB3032982.1 DNA primase [Alteriqipengyuania lutimaris]RDS77942.1 DNA primase [Alteriqipengyuania lutimaris]
MALSPQWLDQLRTRVTLSSVIMRTTKLQRAGREWKACCPFHDEKTPSFTVNDQKGFYHCFGCGAHGDVIRWMTDQRGLTFMDAVKELAVTAGMDMPAPDPREAQRAKKRAGLHDAMGAAQEFFVAELASPRGSAARDYLAKRGFSTAIMREFGFGYAPDERQALAAALGSLPPQLLVEGGLRIAIDGKDPYDRFRDRLMLPIHDVRGRVIAFGGRILTPKESAPKYLNSPETPLFDKGRTLYNIHRASAAARKADRIVVVEGYMDVIALANAGIAEGVAPLGTALTENHIEELWRHAPSPILCFDGDAAGQRAVRRAIERSLPLLRPGHTLRIAWLPSGLDPDDLIKAKGVAAFEQVLEKAQGLLEALWTLEARAAPLDSPEAKAGLKARLMAHVETIEEPDVRALYRRELLDRFSAFAFPKREKAPFQPRKAWKRDAPEPLAPDLAKRLANLAQGGARARLLADVLAKLATFPELVETHREALSELGETDPSTVSLLEPVMSRAQTLEADGGKAISGARWGSRSAEHSVSGLLDEATDAATAREDLAEAIELLVEGPALEKALAAATERFDHDPEGAFAEQQRLLKRKLAFDARLGQMATRRIARPRPVENSKAAAASPENGERIGQETD